MKYEQVRICSDFAHCVCVLHLAQLNIVSQSL